MQWRPRLRADESECAGQYDWRRDRAKSQVGCDVIGRRDLELTWRAKRVRRLNLMRAQPLPPTPNGDPWVAAFSSERYVLKNNSALDR
jgi:hypothetical protein